MLAVWVSPIIVFLALSATRRISGIAAALVALALAAIVVIGAGPKDVGAAEFTAMFVAGAWVALPAVLVIVAGLYFTEVLNAARYQGTAHDKAKTLSARELGTTCLFLGPFVETATGFGVGYVVAVGTVMRWGIGPAGALSLGAFSQCLVPWGALGIGTKISAAIAGAPLDDVTWRVAIVVAPVLWIVVVLYWRIALTCGVTVDSAQRREDLACITVLSVLLIFTNLILPIELAGLCAIGPVLMFRMWRQEGTHLFTLAALRRGAPYLFLMLLLAITKLVPALTTYLSTPAFTPGQGAPVFAPLASPAISLLIATIIGALAHRHWRGLSDSLVPTITKGARACAMTILLVALAWIIVRSGIAHAFAQAMHASLGHHATLTVPLLGSLGGYLTGSNTGAGSLAMPVAKAMAANTEVLWWIAAAAIMVGSMFTAISPVRFAMGQAIANARKEDVGRALRSLTPLALVTVSIAVLTAFFANLWHG